MIFFYRREPRQLVTPRLRTLIGGCEEEKGAEIMIEVHVDEKQIFEIAREEIKTKLKTIESEFVFWDLKTLCEKTCMSRSFVLETFFFLPDFPRHKVGSKWVIPAKEASEYLLQWLKRQPCS